MKVMDRSTETQLRDAATKLGRGLRSFTLATGGFTPALRSRVVFEDGSRAFLKAATDALTAGWLRLEIANYRSLADAPFIPALLDVFEGDDEALPVMLIEDLGESHWPPAWRDGDIDAVLEQLEVMSRWPAPEHLPDMTDRLAEVRVGWKKVEDDPAPFLSLGLCDEAWLERALPDLIAAQGAMPTRGSQLVHLDVRSDNLCIHPERGVLFVDWNWAARGVARYDVAFWLPSLALEGGPSPWEILPESPYEAAMVSGYFCSNAGLPQIPTAPRVRSFQLAQARVALPWAVHALGLEPLPDGGF